MSVWSIYRGAAQEAGYYPGEAEVPEWDGNGVDDWSFAREYGGSGETGSDGDVSEKEPRYTEAFAECG